ncbi:hypothetical protein [Emticicia sp. W12TSBA100-4]|uniref:hypothetical protein n=1 Tax=Emticicia sp. W12TSBA100-4 TaxID=3160965 RepID=UPI003305E716
MKSEIKNRWVKALKTNQFMEAPKGIVLHDYHDTPTEGGVIVRTERFAPIGVLVELFRQDNNIESTPEFWSESWSENGQLPNIEEWAGFSWSNDKYKRVFASIMQADTNHHQVQAIWIRKYMPVTPIAKRLKKTTLKVVM